MIKGIGNSIAEIRTIRRTCEKCGGDYLLNRERLRKMWFTHGFNGACPMKLWRKLVNEGEVECPWCEKGILIVDE